MAAIAIGLLCFLVTSLPALGAAGLPLIIPISSPVSGLLGALVVRPPDGTARETERTWITLEMAERILGEPITSAEELNELSVKYREIRSFEDAGALSFFEPQDTLDGTFDNAVGEADWLTAERQRATSAPRCDYVHPEDFKVRSRPMVALDGWVDPASPKARFDNYKAQRCDLQARTNTLRNGPSQYCSGFISCDRGLTAEFCVCDIVKPLDTAVSVGSRAICPRPDECLRQCREGKTFSGDSIRVDQDPKIRTLARKPPLLVGRTAVSGGLCAFEPQVLKPGFLPIYCYTNKPHCPADFDECFKSACGTTIYGAFGTADY